MLIDYFRYEAADTSEMVAFQVETTDFMISSEQDTEAELLTPDVIMAVYETGQITPIAWA